MSQRNNKEKQRQRAPSQRSLERRERILDAAERVFAQGGYEGATIRRIAAEAGVPLGLVNHHGGSKEDLFREVVARRADALSALRMQALADLPAPPTLEGILNCFFGPYLDKAESGDRQWLAHVRLVALVSADPQWQDISARHFDPAARYFLSAIGALYPSVPKARIAEGFVYAVSAMLAFLTSRWRIGALAGDSRAGGSYDALIGFCAAGFEALLAEAEAEAGPRA